MSYANRLLPEAALQEIDEGQGNVTIHDLQRWGYQTLATIAKKPEVIAAVNKAREIISIDRWRELNESPSNQPTDNERESALPVLKAMPGYCCLMDAVTIIARL